ncbi:uncharacterized protein LOC123312226 [Coccinella septempunctata]|uniref:uncharacterized protein LOC123312226 n=1 Tax=Coccinella septempunctata TaxID=41139 RepID=UPI001D064074|nr:uncharacterized protein LOC123312226 [Coccinella septempunctata]
MDEFFRHFRSFLGLPKFEDSRSGRHEQDIRDPENYIDSRYDIFSSTLEMHRYFEEQMNKIMGEFDIFQFGGSDSFFGDIPGRGEIEFFDRSDMPPLIEDGQDGDLRNQFLKPGFARPTQKHLIDKSDKELKESEININDLDSLVNGDYQKKKEEHPSITTKFFGKSISTKTVMNPDGSMEIHKTIHDNQGNQETTITKRIGDKEHTIIKRIDASGKEEVIENFVNIQQKDASNVVPLPYSNPWSLYERFFK